MAKTKISNTVNVYNDPAHGWAKVSFKDLQTLGILDKITNCSYMSTKGFAFLEEDCDLTTYIKARRELGYSETNFRDHYCNGPSKIRNYYLFDPKWASQWLELNNQA